MPSVQRGQVFRLAGSWGVRWYDENGKRQRASGFATKSEAREWVDNKVEEVASLRRGDTFTPASCRPQTVEALIDLFLERHGRTIDPSTEKKLRAQLKHARAAFGDRHPDGLNKVELEDWREQLPPGSRHDVFRAFRQALAWAVERDLATRNSSNRIKNPKRKRHERKPIVPFESWEEIEAVSAELDARYRAIPAFATGTGLRPEEWIALERGDVDREARVVHVRRRFTGGELKQGGKTGGSVRAVPLRQRVLDELDRHRKRLLEAAVRSGQRSQVESTLLFPAPRGGYIDLERFRHREWTPALRAAGLATRGPYTMRHSFATWAIEADVQLSYLATIMGTSVKELEDTYFRWLTRTDDRLREQFDTYDAAALAAEGGAR
jgi:integrase